MDRFLKGMTYTFKRNLGWRDRAIRTICALFAIGSWYFGAITGFLGMSIAILAIMILGTAISSRCTITYLTNANTMSEDEKRKLKSKGIGYEE